MKIIFPWSILSFLVDPSPYSPSFWPNAHYTTVIELINMSNLCLGTHDPGDYMGLIDEVLKDTSELG